MKNYNETLYQWSPKNALRRLLFSAVYVTLMGGIFFACDNFVDVDKPASQLAAEAVYENKATATAAMTDIYAKIRDRGLLTGYSSGLSHALGLYTDEMDLYEMSEASNVMYYNNTLQPTANAIKELWNNSYNQIYSANAVIEGVTNSKTLATADRDELKGEALFVRALIHFYLTNVYGSVPYVTTTDYKANTTVGKLSTAEVYAKAKEDLLLATELLPSESLSANRTRPTKYAARALIARVNLYAGNWDEAGNDASAVLNETEMFVLENDLDTTFLKESMGTIWSLAANSGLTLEATTFVFTSGPPPLAALSQNLMAAFEVGDERKSHWTNAVTDGTTTWYHANKYKDANGTGTENSIVFRVAEMYLIRAESRAHSGDLIGAKEDLNKIRNNAGLGNTTALSQDEILQAILKERRVELFTEFGHRFFDLKRFNQINPVLSAVKSGWESTDALFPLPESELLVNPNVGPQNPGY